VLSLILTAGTALAAGKVGVSMPTQSLQRWNQDGANLKAQLEAAGYEVDLQFGGDNEVPVQVSQLENMISGGCKVLVISAIDGFALGTVLADAKAQDVKVIAYDRLIMDTDAVSYYTTFDNFRVGVFQGSFIRDKLDLDNAEGPFNIELFTGDPGDNNIHFFFGGAMSVLQPYIDSGKLVVPSGQTTWQQVATRDWSPANAQARMENIITSVGYGPNGVALHAVMCNNDSTAQGATQGLLGAGYTADNFPYVTGQDCDVASVKNMIAGYQSMSVFKDTRMLAEAAVKMVDAIMKGGEPQINDTESYDNGTGIIPTFLCEPVLGTPDNWRELLINSGYYTLDQII
jgi:putative multiple sugar transport system substrate-binding protein